MRSEVRQALITIGAGVVLIVLAGRLAPVGLPPLYDGVVTIEPYRWLHPPAGAPGNPKGASDNIPLEDGRSPLINVATPETPPQASIFAAPGLLTLPPGTTSVKVSIQPVDPTSLPTDGHIVGNTYRFVVTDQQDAPITAPAEAQVTILIRGPGDTVDATIELFSGGAWHPLASQPAGYGSSFLVVATQFGDFALVEPGAAGSVVASGSVPTAPTAGASTSPAPNPATGAGSSGPGFLPVVVGALAVLFLVGVALASRRSTPAAPTRPSGKRRRTPPKGRR